MQPSTGKITETQAVVAALCNTLLTGAADTDSQTKRLQSVHNTSVTPVLDITLSPLAFHVAQDRLQITAVLMYTHVYKQGFRSVVKLRLVLTECMRGKSVQSKSQLR